MRNICHHCGDAKRVKACVTREGETRYFCHTSERSCYNELRGRYWEDNRA